MFIQLFTRKLVTLVIILIGLAVYFSGSTIEKTVTPVIENNLGAVITGIADKTTLDSNHFLVSRVVDGDTIVVKNASGREQKVRLIGINTPETVDPRKNVECFGKEASAKTEAMLLGKIVRIEQDDTQGKYDKYGRLLVYVFLENGELFNRLLIGEGYAYEYTYKLPYMYQKEFKEAEVIARQEEKGLWAIGMCGY